MLRRILAVLALLLLGAATASGVAYLYRLEILRWRQDLPAFTHYSGEVHIERVAMGDGVHLATTVFLPRGDGPWPVVLIRNPYDRFDEVSKGIWCGLLVRWGYGCVYQDVRGQMESEGEWEPLVNERRDGLDTLDWLVQQPWQDGNIALFGPSYLAAVQWAVADALPPEVKTFIPTVMTTDFRRVLYQNGMFRHETFTAWASMMRDGVVRREAGEDYQRAIRHRPHQEVDVEIFGRRLDWYRDWVGNPGASDPLWQRQEFKALLAVPGRTQVPALMIGGWYDVFLGPQMDDFEQLASRSRSKLLIGPWTHIGQASGDLEHPGAEGGLGQWKIVLDWLGHHLRGKPLAQKAGVVETYVLGEERWVERTAWPPPTDTLRWHLTRAPSQTPCTEGLLAATAPTRLESIDYPYDPADPTPTLGGAGMLAFVMPGFSGARPANVWQGRLCEREDVVSFLSEPLAEKLHLAGSIEARLTVSSQAPDTAFSIKLVEVFPDGRALNVRDAITTLAHRNGSGSPLPYEPGTPVEIGIRTWPIEWVAQAGSRIRLDVASADFPKFHAHPNRAGLWSAQTEAQATHQTLWLGPGHTSHLDLPRVVSESPEIRAQ